MCPGVAINLQIFLNLLLYANTLHANIPHDKKKYKTGFLEEIANEYCRFGLQAV